MSTGVVYRHTVETLINNVLRAHELLTPEAERGLRDIGVDPARVQDVPLETWLALLEYCAALGAAGDRSDTALITLGRRWVDGYVETLMGKTTLMVARLIGPKKMLLKMADNWRTTNNFYVATATERSPKHVELELNVGGAVRPFNAGVLGRVLEVMGVTTGRVDTRDLGGRSHFSITWT